MRQRISLKMSPIWSTLTLTKSDECALGLNKARSTFLECSLNTFTFRSNRPETEKSRNRSRKQKKLKQNQFFFEPLSWRLPCSGQACSRVVNSRLNCCLDQCNDSSKIFGDVWKECWTSICFEVTSRLRVKLIRTIGWSFGKIILGWGLVRLLPSLATRLS